ncbi:hypothetical protein CHISP_3016 [Chitinispirillum alkaliphilum]|nr:hypothetical protein CHISP_3016 [Chitinispirillum alkaliphilum]
MKHFDLFVIGTGSAGFAAAHQARKNGLKVGIADELQFGGTCALRGCNPKRLLAGASELITRINHMKNKGIEGNININWSELIQFKRKMTQTTPVYAESLGDKIGAEKFHGHCRFSGKNTLVIGEKEEVSADHILIATGSTPAKLNIPGAENIITSDEYFELTALPKRLLFIGGGYISFELAHVAAQAGAEVVIIEARDKVLGNFDQDLVKMFLDANELEGVKVYTNAPLVSVEKGGDEFYVHAGEKRIKTDLIVHGAGRVPQIGGLDLHAADILTDDKGIVVNEFLQSESNQSVYIAGDVNPEGVQLTTVAEMEGQIAAHNIIHGNDKTPGYDLLSSVVFSFPQLAYAGFTEQQAMAKGIEFDTQFIDTSHRHITRRLGLTHSAFKVLVGKYGRIIGAHMIGYNCDEVINPLLFAIAQKATVRDLKGMNFTFPSVLHDMVHRLA